jgi:hypothetical protein
MKERDRNLVIRIDGGERAKLKALEDAQDENASRLVRRWIREHYSAAFGDVAPRKISQPK